MAVSPRSDGTLPPDVRSSRRALVAQAPDLPSSQFAETLRAVHQLIEQGNDVEAERQLAMLPQDAHSDPQARRATSVLWNNLGVIRGKRDGAEAAIPAFETAISLAPADRIFRLNLTHAYWERKDPRLTREFLERTLELADDEALPHLALADLLYDKDDLAGASFHLEQATSLAAGNPDLQAYLQVVTAKVNRAEQVEQRFSSRKSAHFMVKYDGHEDQQIWHDVLSILEEAYREIGQRFGYFPPDPITVVLHTKATFPDATGSPFWVDGLYDRILGRIQIPTQGALTDRAWLTRVLRHEFVHALLHQRMEGQVNGLPTWLNEGLAMQLAGDRWPDLDQVIQGEITVVPLSSLEGSWMPLPANAAAVAYLEGNSATRYLIDRYGMQKVREIIGQLAMGQPIDVAIKDRLFISYEEFQRRWVQNLNEKLQSNTT